MSKIISIELADTGHIGQEINDFDLFLPIMLNKAINLRD